MNDDLQRRRKDCSHGGPRHHGAGHHGGPSCDHKMFDEEGRKHMDVIKKLDSDIADAQKKMEEVKTAAPYDEKEHDRL